MMLEESNKLLSNYPLLQMTFAALVMLATLWAMIRADKGRKELPPAAQMPGAMKMFFDGPLLQALECLKSIDVSLLRAAEQAKADRDFADRVRIEDDRRLMDAINDAFKLGREQRDLLKQIADRHRRP